MRIFLDCDGVLNVHEKIDNGYSGIDGHCRNNFNALLDHVPDAVIVVHSAWRYLVHSGSMNLEGLQNTLLTHGVKCWQRIEGITESDEDTTARQGRPRADFSTPEAWREWIHIHGCAIRFNQIMDYVSTHNGPFVVLDDIDLGISEQVIVDGSVGLTLSNIAKAERILKRQGTQPG